MNLNEEVYAKQKQVKKELVTKLRDVFPEEDIYIFAVYPKDYIEPLNFNKRGARFIPLTKAKVTYNSRTMNIHFQKYNKKGNLESRFMLYEKHRENAIEIYFDEVSAEKAYIQRKREMNAFLYSVRQKQEKEHSEFIDKMSSFLS